MAVRYIYMCGLTNVEVQNINTLSWLCVMHSVDVVVTINNTLLLLVVSLIITVHKFWFLYLSVVF